MVKENGKNEGEVKKKEELNEWNDVIIIDGGKGKVGEVRKIIGEMGIRDMVKEIGIEKGVEREEGRERFLMEGKKKFKMKKRDKVIYLIKRMREEENRFEIGKKRERRKKEIVRNKMDEIEGIGNKRKREILNNFGKEKEV